jgi:lipase chaperone LimK
MDNEDNSKRLERQARSLILTKDISLEERDTINTYMRDQNMSNEDRYTKIIRLLKKLPDKETSEIEEEKEKSQDIKQTQKAGDEKPADSKKKET